MAGHEAHSRPGLVAQFTPHLIGHSQHSAMLLSVQHSTSDLVPGVVHSMPVELDRDVHRLNLDAPSTTITSADTGTV